MENNGYMTWIIRLSFDKEQVKPACNLAELKSRLNYRPDWASSYAMDDVDLE